MSSVAVDSRLRQRRADVVRAQGRRRLKTAAMVVVLAAVVLGAWQLVHSSVVGVRRVDVSGATRTTRTDIVTAAAVAAGTPMIDVDVAAVGRRVAALPWVDTVEVTRKWPVGLTISVTERTPVAASQAADGTWRLVDRSGRVLAAMTSLTAGVPTVTGDAAPGDPGTDLPPQAVLAFEAIARVPASLSGTVVAAGWDARGAATLQLADGRTVLLPDGVRLGDAFVTLSALLPVAGDTPGVIDLRVPSAPVIRPVAAGIAGPSTDSATNPVTSPDPASSLTQVTP
jgi:cell division protein FtsQ